MTLKRGVLVRGRVTDKATGRPVSGYVGSYTFADNPHVDEFPGYKESYQPLAFLDDDGRYEIVTLPGRGIIACRSDLGRYRQGVGAAAIKGFDPRLGGVGGFNTLPGGASSSTTMSWPRSTPTPRPSRRRWTSRSTPAVR